MVTLQNDGAGNAGTVRVAFDTGSLYGHRTGIGHAVAWTLAALTEQHDVTMLPYVVSARSKPVTGTRRLPLPAAVAHRWWQGPSPPLDRFLGRPDVVHGTNYVVPPTRCPRLVSVYDCWFLERPDDASADVQRAGRLLRRSVDRGAHVVTSSMATTARVRELLDTDRVTTVLLGPPPLDPPALDPPALDPPALESFASTVPAPTIAAAPTIVAIGTLERRKNYPALIRAFSKVAAEHPTARLVVAGAAGNDAEAVRRAIDVLPTAVRERISVPGAIDAAAKSHLLAGATVVAYPSLDEGFGFPLLEAQQHDIPVVASTAGSIPEVAGSAALYSAPDDVDALAANLHLALTSETVRQKLIEQGRRNLPRFSWTNTADQLVELYHHLTNGRPT